MSTAYHDKYFAHELTKRCSSDNLEKIAASLICLARAISSHPLAANLLQHPLGYDIL